MKTSLHPGMLIFIILLLLAGKGMTVSGQQKVTVSGGFGVPEYFNVNVLYPINNSRVGGGFGYLPYNGLMLTASGDYFYHFGGIFNANGKRSWYGRLGFVYNYEESYYNIWHDVYFNPRIGREINFTSRLGMVLDGGVALNVFHRKIKKVDPPWSLMNLDIHFTVLPGVGMRLFYRL